MASDQDDSEDETASTSSDLQHPYDSSSESTEDLDDQEVQGSPVIPPDQSDSTDLPVMTVDGKVDFLVNYMLYKYQVKEVMSMNDIMTLIVREDEDRFHEILMRASERMEMVFGLDVKEVDPINHCYALFIKLGLTYDGMRNDEYSFPKTGLLILILGVVFMKGNRATEEEIWEVLNPMGIYAGMRVLEFVAKVHGSDPTVFLSQYEEALIEEEERTLTMLLEHADSSSTSGESSSDTSSNFSQV